MYIAVTSAWPVWAVIAKTEVPGSGGSFVNREYGCSLSEEEEECGR